MFQLKIQNGNEIAELTNDIRYAVYKIDGLAPPPATLNFSTIANADGKKFNSKKLNERNIVLYIKVYPDAEINRNNLYRLFSVGDKIRLFYKNGLWDVYIDGYIESFECDFFQMNEIVQISIICNDPYFRETSPLTIDFSESVSLFEFPFEIPENEPIEISTLSTGTVIATVQNVNVITGIIIEMTAANGDVINPRFENLRNGQCIALQNTIITENDRIIINTNKFNKSIFKITNTNGWNEEINILNCMTDYSRWIEVMPGQNSFQISAEQGAENLRVIAHIDRLIQGV